MNNKNSGHLQAFLSHIKELNNSPEGVSQILKENAIDATQLEEQGKALADGLIRQLQEKEKAGKVISISSWKWLAAAIVMGLIALSALWWYRQREKKEPVAINEKKGATKFIEDNKREDGATNTLGKDTATSPVAISSVPPRFSPAIAKPNREKKQRAIREQLVKDNLTLDSLPFEVPEALAVASAHYKDQRHQEAMKEYKEILAAGKEREEGSAKVTTRGKTTQEEQTRFYAHYYLAQCYLSINHTQEAIKALESGMEESPGNYWKSKVEWYLALAYLKTGQLQKTKGLLAQVKQNDPSGVYRQKAVQLSRQLKKK